MANIRAEVDSGHAVGAFGNLVAQLQTVLVFADRRQ
jgi:hypothetical protein